MIQRFAIWERPCRFWIGQDAVEDEDEEGRGRLRTEEGTLGLCKGSIWGVPEEEWRNVL
jgi:hypothetical protein